MAISHVSADSVVGDNTLAIPSHATDDVILVYCVEEATLSTPSLPSGYTDIFSGLDANAYGYRICFKKATSGAEADVTFTVDSDTQAAVAISVYRDCNTTDPIGGSAETVAIDGATVTFPSGTLEKADSTSWLVRVCWSGHAGGAMGALADGSVDRVDDFATPVNIYIGDSDGGVSAWGTTTSAAPGWDDWGAFGVELLVAAAGGPVPVVIRPRFSNQGMQRARYI